MRNCGGGVCVSWGVSESECLVSCRLRHCSIQEKGGEREREREQQTRSVGRGGQKEKETEREEKGGESMNVCLVTI